MNRLIQMAAAPRWRLLISAAAHRVHGNAAAERLPMHPGFWLRVYLSMVNESTQMRLKLLA
jgi:hypothetical protein